MTPLAIYDEQPDHFVFIYRVSKKELIERRTALKRALKAHGKKLISVPIRAAHLRRCLPALNDACRRIEAQQRRRRRRRRPP